MRGLVATAAVAVASMGGAALSALAVEPVAVVANYAAIAQAGYGDTLAGVQRLQAAVGELLAEPGPVRLEAARDAWRVAQLTYLQTEPFRFGNPVVDAWEPRVNSWPIDEGLLDYVAGPYADIGADNPWYTANVVANPAPLVAGKPFDAAAIDASLLRRLQEADGIESNVATGWHAVEFFLWGQDLNGTGPGAGDRPWTDYATGEGCTNGNCDRRRAFLAATAGLLVADMAEMAAAWQDGGAARAVVTDATPEAALQTVLTGLGSLAYGELAGERIKLGLLLGDPEEEQDCFSDHTAAAHLADVMGLVNVYRGRYARPDGTVVAGPGLGQLVAASDAGLDQAIQAQLDRTVAAFETIRDRAAGGMAYDQMLAPGNAKGSALLNAGIQALVDLTALLQQAGQALNLGQVAFEGSDSLDDAKAVFE